MDRFRNTGQPDWDWWGRLWPAPGATLRRLGVTPGSTLADVACGNGYFSLPAARLTDPGTVYALDIDGSLLDELNRLAEQQAIENVATVRGDARNLARHLDEPIDAVLIANTFHGIDETGAVVRQAFDSLRPGGRLVVVNWRDLPRETTTVAGSPRGPPTDLRMSPERTTTAVLEASDFAREGCLQLPPYHYALLFGRE